MCKYCFDSNIYNFDSETEFLIFDAELLSKKKVLITNPNHKYLNDIHDIYKCSECQETWWYSQPEYVWRGYFLKQDIAINHINQINESEKNRKSGCIAIFVFLIFVIIILNIKQLR